MDLFALFKFLGEGKEPSEGYVAGTSHYQKNIWVIIPGCYTENDTHNSGPYEAFPVLGGGGLIECLWGKSLMPRHFTVSHPFHTTDTV